MADSLHLDAMMTQNTTGFTCTMRRLRLPLVAACALVSLMLCPATFAQGGRAKDNVLYPRPIPIPLYIGPEFGYGQWRDDGYFAVGDGAFSSCALFENGSGDGVTYGAKAMVYLNTWFFISPRVRYEPRPGTFKTDLQPEPARDIGDSIVMVDRLAQVDATFASLTIDATIGVEFFKSGLYVFGGGSGGLMLDGYYDYTEQLTGSGDFIYRDTGGDLNELVSGKSFATYQKTAFALRGGGGYLLKFGRIVVNPEVFYSYPLTSALGAPEEMKQTGVIGTVSLMYNLGD